MAERFFFDTFDGREFLRDTEGLALSDLAHARREAFRALADMAAEGVGQGQLRKLSITIRDKDGLCFECAIAMTLRNCA